MQLTNKTYNYKQKIQLPLKILFITFTVLFLSFFIIYISPIQQVHAGFHIVSSIKNLLLKSPNNDHQKKENQSYQKGISVTYKVPFVASHTRVIVKYKSFRDLKLASTKDKKLLATTKAVSTPNKQLKLLHKLGPYKIFKVPTNRAVAFINSYKRMPGVQSVTPDYVATINTAGTWQTINSNGILKDYPSDFDKINDPLNGRHWYLEKQGFPEFWHMLGCANNNPLCTTPQNIVVAIIDTGLATSGTTSSPTTSSFVYTNSCSDTNNDGTYTADECLLPIAEDGDLNFQIQSIASTQISAENIWTNPDESATPQCNDIHGVDIEIYKYNNENNIANDCSLAQRAKEGIPADDYGHGTFIAHIIAATTSDTDTPGSVALTPNIKIMPIKANIPFTGMFYIDRLASAVIYAVDNGAKIINMSLSTGYDVDVLRDAMQYALDHGVIIVAATGNAGQNSLEYPAAYTTEFPNVIAVAARNRYGDITSYSNYTPDAFAAYVGDGATATNAIETNTISCNMDDNDCAPVKDDADGIYKKDNTSFIDTAHIGTSFAAPQTAGEIAELLIRDNGLSVTRIRALLNSEIASPTGSDKTLNIYKTTILPYFNAPQVLLKTQGKDSMDFIENKPLKHPISLFPQTFIVPDPSTGEGLEILQVTTGETPTNNIAWWYLFNPNKTYNTILGEQHFKTLIPDFGNDGPDAFFMANLLDTDNPDNNIKDAGEDVAIVRFTPDQQGNNTNIKIYLGSRNINTSTNSEYINYIGYTSFNKDTTYTQDDLMPFFADVTGDGKADFILQVKNGNTSDFYVAHWYKDTQTNKIYFGPDLIQWKAGVDSLNSMFLFTDINNDGKKDLVQGKIINPTTVQWNVFLSTGASFQNSVQLISDAGNSGDIFVFKRTNADAYPDLVIIRVKNNHQVQWYTARNNKDNTLQSPILLDNDFGNYGDHFFMSDINGDGIDDPVVIRKSSVKGSEKGGSYTRGLINVYTKINQQTSFEIAPQYNFRMPDIGDIIIPGDYNGDSFTDLAIGRHLGLRKISWFVSLNNNGALSSPAPWKDDFGDIGDMIFAGDVDSDNRSDLILKRIINKLQVSWYVSRSTGTQFTTPELWESDFGNAPLSDQWYVADVNGDHKADLLLSRLVATNHVRWYVELSSGSQFQHWTKWKEDFGNNYSLDNYFVADITGDDKADLLLGRISASDPTIVTWYASISTGSTFGDATKWINDYGNKGDKWLVEDFNNDNKADILLLRETTTPVNYLAPSTGTTSGQWLDIGQKNFYFGQFYTAGQVAGDNYKDMIELDPSYKYGALFIIRNHIPN